MKKYLLVAGMLAATFILTGCGEGSYDPALMSVMNAGKIEAVGSTSYDWGDIDIQGGKKQETFTFKNSGDEDLIVKGAQTSCMCTTAQIKFSDGKQSPIFGMHGHIEWLRPVKSNETFDVEVIFDPMAHGPSGTGKIQRSVYLMSSSQINGLYTKADPNFPKAVLTEISLKGNVLSQEEYKNKQTTVGLNLKEKEFDFGVIKQSGGIVSHDFEFEYLGEQPIKVTDVPTSCACTTAKISQNDYKKGDKGVVTVEFDPNLHEEPEGKFFKTISLITEPPLEQQPELKIWVEIDLDLGKEAYKLKHDDSQ